MLENHPWRDRSALGEFAVEGVRAVRTALHSGNCESREIFVTQEHLTEFVESDPTLVSDAVMKKMSGTQHPQGVIAIFSLPPKQVAKVTGNSIYLHQLSDPGNAGTIIRNAHAFGFQNALFSSDSVDPFAGKVARATAGSITYPSVSGGVELASLLAQTSGSHHCLALDMAGSELGSMVKEIGQGSPKPILLLMGSEAHGVPEIFRIHPQVRMASIPMPGGTESLNVAACATIAMYEISRIHH